MALTLDRRQPLHFIGVGGIGMSAIAGILADRGFAVSGSDPRDNAVLADLRSRGVRVFPHQNAATIRSILATPSAPRATDPPADLAGQGQPALKPLVVVSSAVPKTNPELQEARRLGLEVCHRSDVLGALIRSQSAIAIAGSHGKTTTSTLVATLLAETNQDPTAVIGGIVPAFGSNGRSGAGPLLVAEADESDGSLVKFPASLAVITNLELDHTDHYPDLDSLISTLQRFAQGCESLLANRDDPILREHFEAQAWWSVQQTDGVDFASIPLQLNGDSSVADFYEAGELVGRFTLPLPGLHNLSNATGALAACRLQGVPFAGLSAALASLQAPGRRFDYRGTWQGRQVVDDYAHHPSEVAATLAMARLMVSSGRSPLPSPPKRLVAVFQPHRYTRTAQFMQGFAEALSQADVLVLAPLYTAGEAPITGISSEALAVEIQRIRPELAVGVARDLDDLADRVGRCTLSGDLVLAMGAGDVNGLWSRLQRLEERQTPLALAA